MHIKTEWTGGLWVISAVVDGKLQEFAAKQLLKARELFNRAKCGEPSI